MSDSLWSHELQHARTYCSIISVGQESGHDLAGLFIQGLLQSCDQGVDQSSGLIWSFN